MVRLFICSDIMELAESRLALVHSLDECAMASLAFDVPKTWKAYINDYCRAFGGSLFEKWIDGVMQTYLYAIDENYDVFAEDNVPIKNRGVKDVEMSKDGINKKLNKIMINKLNNYNKSPNKKVLTFRRVFSVTKKDTVTYA